MILKCDTFYNDLSYCIWNLKSPTLTYRKIICGMNNVNDKLYMYIYDNNELNNTETLNSIFSCFNHNLFIGECKFGNMYNTPVVIVQEDKNKYIIHKIKLSYYDENIYEFSDEYIKCDKFPENFKKYDKSFWFG